MQNIDIYHLFIVDQKIKPGAFLYGFNHNETEDLKIFNSTVSYIRRHYPNINIKTSTKRFPHIFISHDEINFTKDSASEQDIGNFLGYKSNLIFKAGTNAVKFIFDIKVKCIGIEPVQLFAVADDCLMFKPYYDKWTLDIKVSLMNIFPEIEDVFLVVSKYKSSR